jgi:hypothetical protein
MSAPSLQVSSVQFLRSNSLASNVGQDRYFATHNEIGALNHEIGIFPQSVGNIPHRKSQGYVVRRETCRVAPETNPDTVQIVHLHTIELYGAGSDEVEAAILHHGTAIALSPASGAECRRSAVEVLPQSANSAFMRKITPRGVIFRNPTFNQCGRYRFQR